MIQQLLDATRVALESATLDEHELREIRNAVADLFQKQGVPFTTETLHACYVGMATMLFAPHRAHSRHLMAGIQAIVRQRKDVEAQTNV